MRIRYSYRIIFWLVADFCVNAAILMITYPIWREFHYQRHSGGFWLRIYLSASVIATIIASVAAILATFKKRHAPDLRSVVAQMVLTFALLSTLAVYADFSSPDPASSWPDLIQEIAAKFCSELQSIRFTLVTASSIALASGLLLWLTFVRKTKDP